MREGSKLSKKQSRLSAGRNEPMKDTDSDSTVKKQTSIQSFFAVQAKREEKKVPCPICEAEVLYKNINEHLDSCTGPCNTVQKVQTDVLSIHQESTQTTITEESKISSNSKTEITQSSEIMILSAKITNQNLPKPFVYDNRKKEESKELSCSEPNILKRRIENDTSPIHEANQKKLKTDEEFSDNDEEFVSLCLDTEQIKEGFKSPVKASPTNFQSPTKIKLSPSISYNPARYGGIKALQGQDGGGGTEFVRTSSKTAAEKWSPRKRKKMGTSTLPDLPQHDPYTPSKRQDVDYVPYYVTNFEYILTCVIDCTDDYQLFSPQEIQIIESYRKLPLSARKLYVRLFNRKHTWILESSMKYDECPDIHGASSFLVSAKLLLNKEQLEDLEECLNILLLPEIKLIAKEFNVNNKMSSKQDIIQELNRMCEKKSIFQTKSTLKEKVVKRGRSLVGSCYKLHPESRSVLNRVLCLWGVSKWWGEREDDRPPNSLTTLLLANQGKLVFPQYSILRERQIFRGREDLIECETAMKLVDRLETAIATKDFDAGYSVYQEIEAGYKILQDNTDLMKFIKGLPVFLRKLTMPAVFIYGLSRSVDLLEKMKDYSSAVALLKLLLHTDFLHKYRGVWYERLCLDLESHLKNPRESLDWIQTALQDKSVRGARRLALHHRVTKLCTAKRNLKEFGDRLEEFTGRQDWQDPSSQDLPTVVISGRMISKDGLSSTKSIFMLVKDGETTYCNVEELVRDHYKDEGLYEGSHAEGALLNSILTLLFWDIIYHSEIPDAFRDPAQTSPLDWDTDDFYASRKDMIDERLLQISRMTREELSDEIEDYFTTYLNVSSMVNWDLCRNQDYLRGLVMCFEPAKLAKIMERMIKDHRTYRSGLPDLTCWNPETKEIRIVEVKGPGDKLSYKQILWIRFFISIGILTEVCHVDPTGSAGGANRKNKTSPKAKISPNKVNKSPKESKSPKGNGNQRRGKKSKTDPSKMKEITQNSPELEQSNTNSPAADDDDRINVDRNIINLPTKVIKIDHPSKEKSSKLKRRRVK